MISPNFSLIEKDILYQDDFLLAYNKPAGILSIPDGYDPSLPHVGSIMSGKFGKVWIVHRLDRETSGVILLARTQAAHRNLNLQFEQRQVSKKYHALINTHPDWQEIEIDYPLRVNADRKHRTLVAPLTGKAALTSVRVIARYSTGCLLEVSPHTGYTHQIRAHLAAIGMPIMGDIQYATIQPIDPQTKTIKSYSNNFISRVALHARSISFKHPISEKELVLYAEYPFDFSQAISSLSM